MKQTLLSAAIVLAALPATSLAQRYQVVAAPEGGRFGQTAAVQSRVFILDTQEGHYWTWGESEILPGGREERRIGPALIYQGKLRPGKQPGEVIEAPPR